MRRFATSPVSRMAELLTRRSSSAAFTPRPALSKRNESMSMGRENVVFWPTSAIRPKEASLIHKPSAGTTAAAA
jgi:hypothetical protein